MEEVVTLTGVVESVVYMSEASGFAVLELDAGDGPLTAVGPLYGVAVGEELILTGRYGSHPTYGRQFRAEIFERKMPANAAAIQKYLSGGALKGVGPRTAERLVKCFGNDTLNVIEKDPVQLADVPGISLKKAQGISEEYRRIFGIRTALLELGRHGVEAQAAIRAWKLWGPKAPEVLRENPYDLCHEEVGLTFEQADGIAFGLKLDPASPARVRAGVCHVLSHNLLNGHTCLPRHKLLSTASELLEAEAGLAEDALDGCARAGTLVEKQIGGVSYIYLPEMFGAESYIAQRVALMLESPQPESGDCKKEIAALESALGIEYAALQRRAISTAMGNNIFILAGGPGTGKTTTLKALLHILEQSGEKVSLAAPTGRAAKRMSELTGREARTIHRLLEVEFREGSERPIFKRDEKNPLRATTVILDEVSMVDTRLFASLLKALRLTCRLVLVGDPDQLPSVGAGNCLRDLIQSDAVPAVHLNEIFRQAEASAIVANAHKIIKAEPLDLTSNDRDFFFMRRQSGEETAKTLAELCSSRLPKAYGFSPLWDIQVICPGRKGPLGTVELNQLLQESLNPAAPGKQEQKLNGRVFREGDKIMQVKNNYNAVWRTDVGEEGAGVFNGDIGVLEMLDRPSRSMLIRFEDRLAEYTFDMADELEHAWAITVHKSQGSEFMAVLMPILSFHPRLCYRNLLYTGVTRARRLMIVLGSREAVLKTAANHRKTLRYTNLKEMLLERLCAL